MRKKIMIASGSYTTQDGQQKTTWKEVGVIMTSQAGKDFCLLDPTVNLAGFPSEPGKDMIIASIFEDKPKEQQQGGYSQPAPQQAQQSPQQQYQQPQAPQQPQAQQQFDQNGQQIPF